MDLDEFLERVELEETVNEKRKLKSLSTSYQQLSKMIISKGEGDYDGILKTFRHLLELKQHIPKDAFSLSQDEFKNDISTYNLLISDDFKKKLGVLVEKRKAYKLKQEKKSKETTDTTKDFTERNFE